MKIDGFTLQQAVREAKAERDQASKRFTPALKKFPGEEKPDPRELAEAFIAAEIRLARLQSAQTLFNLTARVQVQGETMSLLEAIKLVGGAGRLEAMWRSAATPETNRYSMNEDTRQKDTIVAEAQVSFDEAGELRRKAGKRASALRAAIQKGNAQEIDLDVDLKGLLS